MKSKLLILTVLILSLCSANGQESSCADTFDLRILFRAGGSELEPSFGNNAAVLSDAVRLLRTLKGDTTIVLQQMHMEIWSLSEGAAASISS